MSVSSRTHTMKRKRKIPNVLLQSLVHAFDVPFWAYANKLNETIVE